jgi:hypothetical protein
VAGYGIFTGFHWPIELTLRRLPYLIMGWNIAKSGRKEKSVSHSAGKFNGM